jgi:hypothetical protein
MCPKCSRARWCGTAEGAHDGMGRCVLHRGVRGDWAGAKPVRQAFILFLLFLQFSIFLLSYLYFQIFNSNSSKLHHECKHNFIIIYLLFLSFMQILLNMHPKIFILGK